MQVLVASLRTKPSVTPVKYNPFFEPIKTGAKEVSGNTNVLAMKMFANVI